MRPMLSYCLALVAALCTMPIASAQQMPDDSQKNQLIVVGLPTAPPAKWFDSNPNLARVKSIVQFSLLRPTDALYRERFQQTLGTDFPIVAYMRPDGGVIYYADRNSIPATSEELFTAIKAAALQAKNAAKPNSLDRFSDMLHESQFGDGYDMSDCPDGNCPLPTNDSPRFPRLKPLAVDPFGVPKITNWFSDSVSSIMWVIGGVIVMGFVLVFFILALGALYLVTKFIK